jgi:hypothetical protein
MLTALKFDRIETNPVGLRVHTFYRMMCLPIGLAADNFRRISECTGIDIRSNWILPVQIITVSFQNQLRVSLPVSLLGRTPHTVKTPLLFIFSVTHDC